MWHVFFRKKHVFYEVLSIGVNYIIKHTEDINHSIHAEDDCVRKLKPNRKRIIDVDVVILCFRKDNTLKDILPCNRCLGVLSYNLSYKGYRIKNVYHSVEGVVTETSFKNVIILVNKQKKTEKKTYYKIKKKISIKYF